METESCCLLIPLDENRMNDIRLKYRKKERNARTQHTNLICRTILRLSQQITTKQINENYKKGKEKITRTGYGKKKE